MTALILIPGLACDAAVWQRTIDALDGAADCRVGDTLSDDTLPAMAERILAAAPARFALAGLSMGGMVALEIMRIAPERVIRLALVDSSALPDTPDQAARRLRVNASLLRSGNAGKLIEDSLSYLVHPDAPAEIGQALVAMAVRLGPETYVRQNLAIRGRPDYRPQLPGIAVPTWVVVGERDRMTPPERAQELRDGIPGARLEVVPDCGHLPPIEKPATMAALLRDWLGA